MQIKFLLPLLLFGCAALQPVVHQPNEKTPPEKTDTVKIISVSPKILEAVKSAKEENAFKVALLLPFYTEELTFDSLYLNLSKLPPKSALAIHYYEGVLLALDSLDKLGLKVHLHVFNCPNDSLHAKEILEKPEMKEMDALIGPVNNSSLLIAARFGAENKKYIFSPLSSSVPVTDNPYFVLANATLKTHCETIANYIAGKYKPEKVILLFHEEGNEQTYSGYFKNTFSETASPFQWIELTENVDSSYFKIEKYLSTTTGNIVVIPSFDEVFVNVMTKQLAALAEDYKITVFGMPTWTEMESLRTDYLQQVNTHITGSFWLNSSSASVSQLRKQYFNKFKSKPDEYTIRGYDLMHCIGSLMLKEKNKWFMELEKNVVKEAGDCYDIEPVYAASDNGKKEIQYLENKHVYILKYADNALVKVK